MKQPAKATRARRRERCGDIDPRAGQDIAQAIAAEAGAHDAADRLRLRRLAAMLVAAAPRQPETIVRHADRIRFALDRLREFRQAPAGARKGERIEQALAILEAVTVRAIASGAGTAPAQRARRSRERDGDLGERTHAGQERAA